ncbi:HIT-like protein [Ceratobasidium sp. AG-I]|nr:HIT-like protein [Ceratobasidium sp. AG-I]
MAPSDDCIFCKIVRGEIPSMKLLETDHSYAFMNIGPVSTGHSLVISKYHGERLHDIPDDYLVDLLPIVKKIAVATGATDYNILQNNGKIAHQHVTHVHFHIIPKPSATDSEGLVIGWPLQEVNQQQLQKLCEEIKSKL